VRGGVRREGSVLGLGSRDQGGWGGVKKSCGAGRVVRGARGARNRAKREPLRGKKDNGKEKKKETAESHEKRNSSGGRSKSINQVSRSKKQRHGAEGKGKSEGQEGSRHNGMPQTEKTERTSVEGGSGRIS